MNNNFRLDPEKLAYFFAVCGSITVIVYLLRGFGILTFIPGGIIFLLIIISLISGIIYGIELTKNY
jgi:hypothetical protein